MAFIRMDHVSDMVKMNLPLNIILPGPGEIKGVPVRERKILYLLHGMGDDASAWQRYSSIETYAAMYGLVVVMPSGGRSFYADLPNGQQYYSYLTQELPQFLSDVFDLNPPREDTLIAGNSMGGYAVLRIAFDHPERFFAAASFSGFLSLEFLKAFPDDPRLAEFAFLFGDLNRLSGSRYDPATWFQEAARDPSRLQRLYLSCGQQDDLYPLNLLAHAALKEASIAVDFYQPVAKHNWLFWDAEIRRFLASVLG
jgi:putative tributyrin esterase